MASKANKKTFSELTSMVLLFALIITNAAFANASIVVKSKGATTSVSVEKLTTDLTQLARSGQIRQAAIYDHEVDDLVNALLSDGTRQPVLVDETGESQNMIVESLAVRVAKGDVPEALRNRIILKLQVNAVFAENRAIAAKNIEAVLRQVSKSNNETILFIDDLQDFVGATGISDSLANLLRENSIRLIGGSSTSEFEEGIATNAEVASLFSRINVGNSMSKMNDNVANTKSSVELFRGDLVSSDLREMLAQDPTGTKRVDVIIQAKDANSSALRSAMAQNDIRVTERIGNSKTLVANLSLSAVEALAQTGAINYVSPDRPTKLLGHVETTTGTLNMRSQPALGTRAAYTLDGTGVGIAIVDSGLLVNHKAFQNSALASRIAYSQNFVDSESTTDDNYGHGTHVAGLAAGRNSRNSGAYTGIASNAKIINLRVLDSNGLGRTSWLLSALDWIKLNRTTYNIRVVNLSLGALAIDTWTNDPICVKVRELAALGIIVVAAAGNDGKNLISGVKEYGHIHSPANDPTVLTVGSTNSFGTDSRSDDGITTFSSRGPTRSFYSVSGVKKYDNLIKPDIVAPGNRVISAKAKSTSTLISMFPTLTDSTLDIAGDDNDMMYMSGTSMSAPIVSGAAALLLQVNPNLTPSMVKMILQYTAQSIPGYNMFEQGAGELNVDGAVKLARVYKTGMTFNGAKGGSGIIQTSTSFPTPSSVVGSTTITWAQGIITGHAYLRGENLATKYHGVFNHGKHFKDGINYTTAGVQSLNSQYSATAGITLSPTVVKSTGGTLGTGTIFLNSTGVLIGDGVLLSDGVLFGDGVLMSDGVLLCDGVLISDGIGALMSFTRLSNVILGDQVDNQTISGYFPVSQ